MSDHSRSSRVEDGDAAEANVVQRNEQAFPIVGIGASAGGLEAFGQLLQHLPADTGMAFVLIQHLDPAHESRLAPLLSKGASIPVTEVNDTPVVKPNNAYVIPPNKTMTIVRGQLQLTPRSQGSAPHLSIDCFFRSLAADRQERAIGVLLSGTGFDGTAGLAEIKDAGGITFAQDDKTAKYPDMPLHAVASGCVDSVLSPEGIAAELARMGQHSYLRARATADEPPTPVSSDEVTSYQRILALLRASSGVDLSDYRDQTIRRRIARRMALQRLESLAEYANYLKKNRSELDALYRDILINVTSFFRDAEVFEALKTLVFPEIINSRSAEVPVRIWVPGCSTGQEAYSLGIALLEFLDQAPARPPIQIFGTDISDSGSIDRARAACYPSTIESEVSPERLRRFFVKESGGYRVGKLVRDLCVFAKQNITADPPFSKMDLISCRNLLIYLNSKLQQRIIPTLHYALNPTGFLLLGASESVGRFEDLFKLVDKKCKIHAKNPEVIRPLPYFPAETRLGPAASEPRASSAVRPPGVADLQREADRIDLNRYAPAGVLVNDELEVIQFRGRTRPYLEPPSGEASYDLLRMARENLFLPLRSAIEEARKQHTTIHKKGVQLRDDNKTRRIDLEVTPVTLPGSAHGGFLIHFQEIEPRPEATATGAQPPAPGPSGGQAEVEQLREELAQARHYLQSIIEQQSAANEELKSANEEVLSANEELQSTNEELQTSKEEAQSVNEELRTVNDELQSRNTEIAQTNDDLTNLLSSVGIPIVILGMDMCIRRFTPAATKTLNLVATDLGRPLDRLRLPLNVPDLQELMAEVVVSAIPRERDVRDDQGHAYLLRIHPYRTADNRIDGVTLVLFDIDAIRKAQESVQASRDYAMAIVQSVQNPLLILDADLRVRTASREFCEAFRVSSQEIEGQLFYEMCGGQWDDVNLRKTLSGILPNGTSVELEIERDLHRIGRRNLLINARRLLSQEGTAPLILVMLKDVTDRKQLEARLRERVSEVVEANTAKDQFLAALSHELRTPLTPVLLTASALERRHDLPADVLEALAVLHRNVSMEARLIDDLLDLTRIARGKLKLDLHPQNAFELIKQTMQIFEADINAKRLHVTVDLKADHCEIMADGPRMQQVFWNLIRNAIKFTPDEGHIAVRAFNDEQARLVIQVADTGIGIEADVLPNLFQAFEQGRSNITRRFGGLGLGLAIAKSLVELHRGSIRAESLGANRGATFTVELPVSLEKPRAPVQTREPDAVSPVTPPPASRPLSLLLVEDHKDTADLLEQILKGAGYQVKTASSVATAKQLAANNSFDLVISDLGLPDGSGLDLMKHLRDKHGLKGIALTGYGMEEDVARTREAGFAEHLVKPINFDQLEAAIPRLVQAR